MSGHGRLFVESYDGGFAERGRTWSLVDSESGDSIWSVNRRDISPREHVFRAERHSDSLPEPDDLALRTAVFVRRLLEQLGLNDDPSDWVTQNFAAMLTLASWDLASWQGNEWAFDFEPNRWLPADSPRRVYDFLAVKGSMAYAVFRSYQDMDFGLGCEHRVPPKLVRKADEVRWGRRGQTGLPGVNGRVSAVDVLFESRVRGMEHRALPVEVVIHGLSGAATLIVSGDQYVGNDGGVTFRRFDTEVILVPDAPGANSLYWPGGRPRWVSQSSSPKEE